MSRSPLRQAYALLPPFTAKLRARWLWTVAFLLLVAGAELAGAAATHRIVQKGRAFGVGEITIARGDTLLFTNEDEFLHQIYVASGGMTFERAGARPDNRRQFSKRRHLCGPLPYSSQDAADRARSVSARIGKPKIKEFTAKAIYRHDCLWVGGLRALRQP